MKKFICFFMVLTMMLAVLSGCVSNDKSDSGSKTPRYIYERVCIIGCDGAGRFFRETDTPNIDRIFENGAVTYDCLAMDPTISAQCWGSMIHGIEPKYHLLDNTNTARNPYDLDSYFPSFFKVVRENDPDCKMASFCKWDNINVGIVEDGLGIYKSIAADDIIAQQACDYIEKNDPKVMLIVFNDPDTGGHTYGYGSQGQYDAITLTDSRIGMVYDAYEAKGWLDSTLFIVTADHGGKLGTMGHGGLTDEEKYVMFAAVGKSVPKGTVGEMDLRDVASIVTYALGYEQPDTWTARVPSGVFEGVEAGVRPVFERKYDVAHRTHESTPTPAIGSGKSIADAIGANRIGAYLTFDQTLNDALGKYQTSRLGGVPYDKGYFGKGVEINTGSVALTNCSVGTNSFSIMMWVNVFSAIDGDPLLFANKDWSNGGNPGFALSMRSGNIKFNISDGKTRFDDTIKLPKDYFKGWVHITFVVDREAGELRFAYDFGDFVTFKLPASLKGSSFDALSDLVIGNDGTKKYSKRLPAMLDEFVLVNGALTADDLKNVAAVYAESTK